MITIPSIYLFQRIRLICSQIGILLSVALAVVTVAGGFLIPTKPLGVAVAAFGCFASGWLFSVALGKALATVRKDGADERRLRADLESEQRKNAEAQSRIAALEADNQRLKHQRIDINAVRPILKLGLAEAEMSIKDVKTCWTKDFDSGSWVSSPTRSRYVGVLQRSFKAAYGVDLQKLHIREDGDVLRIAGIAPESIGLKNDRTEWLLRQVQTFPLKKTSLVKGVPIPAPDPQTGFASGDDYYEIDREKAFTGSLDLNRTQAEAALQERELGDRIDKGIGAEFQNINVYIREMAQEFLKYLFSPVKKSIVFVDTPLAEIEGKPDWLLLEDFAKGYNRQLEAPNE